MDRTDQPDLRDADRLWVNARLATFDPAVPAPYGLRDSWARAARRLPERLPVEVSPTLLAAHAVPPEFAGRGEDYVSLIAEEIIPAAARDHLAEAVDVFCEHIAFSPAQCDRVFAAARRHGLA